MDEKSIIYVISDSIGETADQVTRAAAAQYGGTVGDIRRIPYVSEKQTIKEIINEAKKHNSIIVYTMVIPELKEYLEKEAKEQGLVYVDIMGPVIEAISHITKTKPTYTPGIIRQLDDEYFKKVEAIEFAVKYDDGKDARGIKKADIVLVGVSRTSKTPLSMYLAHKYFKVANVPLVPEVPAPEELFEKDPRRVFGLIANPFKLNEIRQERLKSLGLSNNANYASIERINYELEYSKRIMEKLNCMVIDVSSKAVEETAGIIISHMKENFGDEILE